MGSQASNAFQVATAFGDLAMQGAIQSNEQRTAIAQANFATGEAQIEAQADERQRELATVFAKHQGTLRANAAFRSTGVEGVETAVTAASAEASIASKNIEINAANLVGSLAASSQIILEDPVLAQIQGTFEGLSAGSQFSAALANAPDVPLNTNVFDLPEVQNLLPDIGEILNG